MDSQRPCSWLIACEPMKAGVLSDAGIRPGGKWTWCSSVAFFLGWGCWVTAVFTSCLPISFVLWICLSYFNPVMREMLNSAYDSSPALLVPFSLLWREELKEGRICFGSHFQGWQKQQAWGAAGHVVSVKKQKVVTAGDAQILFCFCSAWQPTYGMMLPALGESFHLN